MDRYLWGPTDLTPTDKDDRDAFAARAMDRYLRAAGGRRRPARQTPADAQK